jgi:hypothetical protein
MTMHAPSPSLPRPLVPETLLASYAGGPTAARVSDVRDTFQRISAVIGPEFQVYVVGSYATGTVAHDDAELDVLAAWQRPKQYHNFDLIFELIEGRLKVNRSFGAFREMQTTIRVEGDGLAVNIVPAIVPELPGCSPTSDPLMTRVKKPDLWRTYPHHHMQTVAQRNSETGGSFVPVVRLLKRWVREHGLASVAQGFFLETAVCNAPEACFGPPVAQAFMRVAQYIRSLEYPGDMIVTTFGDKSLFQATQWEKPAFLHFQQHLAQHLPTLEAAVTAPSEAEAVRLWRNFFNAA